VPNADFIYNNRVYEIEVNREEGWFDVYLHLPTKAELILQGDYDGGPITDCTNHLDEGLCLAINERIIHLWSGTSTSSTVPTGPCTAE